MQTIQRANPDVWVTPLRALHAEIDRLIELVNITPLLTTLEQKEKELFAQAQQAIASGLDAVHLPAPLDAFYAEMKAIVLGLTDAIFGDPDGTLRKVNLSLTEKMKPSSLFQPLDLAFDKLLAAIDTRPAQDVLGAFEAIRKGMGAALPVMNPANILQAMREAEGRVAAVSPAALPGVVTLPGLRVSLAARLAVSTAHGEAKAALLARFDLVLAPLSVGIDNSRMRRLTAAHEALVAAFRRRIAGLDSSGAQAAFQELDTQLGRILPAFLRQPAPLDAASVQAGLATMRPSTKARRIDLAVGRFLDALKPLQGALDRRHQRVLPGDPRRRVDAAPLDPQGRGRRHLHDAAPEAARARPGRACRIAAQERVGAADGSVARDRSGGAEGAARRAVPGSAGEAHQQGERPARPGEARDRRLPQSAAAGPVAGALRVEGADRSILAGVAELLAQLDRLLVDDLFKRLLTLLGNLETSFNEQIDRVRKEFDAMLNAAPVGGFESGGGVMTMLERIRAWDAVQSADREIVADAGLPREVREAGALSRYAWQAGELTGIVEPDGTRLNYGYGEDGRLLWVDRNGARFADYRYDAQGRLTDVVRPDGPLSHAYDENGRLVRTLRGDASPFIYRWDGQHVASAQCDREETRFHHDARRPPDRPRPTRRRA